MIIGVGTVLAIKTYLLLFVLVDLTVGVYSFFTCFILFNIFLISFTRYKDPYTKPWTLPFQEMAV
jgi:hypothetical protein